MEKPESATKVESCSDSPKMFQKPVILVKQLKLSPKTIDNGFVSIEKIEEQHYLIQRSFTG